jgi:hypothetical protein
VRRSRLAWTAAALLAAACGEAAKPQPGPLDRVYMPTGLAVHRAAGGEARLIVASSNADLRYDDVSGGAVLSIEPEGAGTTFGVNIRSFAGELAIARNDPANPAEPDPAACGTAVPGAVAITAMRGSDTLDAILVAPGGLSCWHCDVPLAGPTFGDPFAVAVACGGGRARAFVGHLRSFTAEAVISEYDLDPDRQGRVRTVSIGAGPVRSLAYDPARDRLYVIGLATGSPTPLRWLELRDCELGLAPGAGGCSVGSATFPSLPPGLELRAMALAHANGKTPQRAFLTARLYDPVSAALHGGRTTDDGGLLLVVDLVDNALGGVDAELIRAEPIGRGAQDVRVLPLRAGLGEVVAALSVDDASLWIYDDETGRMARLGREDALGGGSELGGEPFGLAVDPEAAGTARVYVGSFRESFITPVDVPLAAPDAAVVVSTAGATRRITGGTQ